MSDYLSDEEIEALDAEIEGAEDADRAGITESKIKQAAALAVAGGKKLDIGKKLKLTMYAVNKIYGDERFKKHVADIGDDAVAGAKTYIRGELARMSSKAMKALEKNLDKDSLEAVKVALRALGMDGSKPEEDKGGGFTLVLANQKPAERVVVVKNDDAN